MALVACSCGRIELGCGRVFGGSKYLSPVGFGWPPGLLQDRLSGLMAVSRILTRVAGAWLGCSVGIIACAEGGTLGSGGPAPNQGGTSSDAGSLGGTSSGGASGHGGSSGSSQAGTSPSGGTGNSTSGGVGGASTGGTGGNLAGGTGGLPQTSGGSGPTTGGTGPGTTGGTGAGGTGAGGSGGSPGCNIVNHTFDASDHGWTASGTNSDWSLGVPNSGPNMDHTGGGRLWATNLSGNANDCQNSALTSPVIDLSGRTGVTMLRFWHWYDFAKCKASGICSLPCAIDYTDYTFSGGVIEAKDSAGNWNQIAPTSGKKIECFSQGDSGMTCSPCDLDNKRGFSGTSGGWVQQEVDVSAYAHSEFQVRFRFASYEADNFLPGCWPQTAGWYIDDVRIAPQICP